jgi:hypothetical protein
VDSVQGCVPFFLFFFLLSGMIPADRQHNTWTVICFLACEIPVGEAGGREGGNRCIYAAKPLSRDSLCVFASLVLI